MDLTPFALINPCGYPDLKVTQMCDLTDNTLSISDIQNELSQQLIKHVTRS
jgi:lipoyl(octanoyl) transferase